MKSRSKLKPFPPGYIHCCERLAALIPQWIEEKSKQRFLDLRWQRWTTRSNKKICYAGSLDPVSAKMLAASPDAEELLAYLFEQTSHQATLLQTKVVLEHLGIKAREDNN